MSFIRPKFTFSSHFCLKLSIPQGASPGHKVWVMGCAHAHKFPAIVQTALRMESTQAFEAAFAAQNKGHVHVEALDVLVKMNTPAVPVPVPVPVPDKNVPPAVPCPDTCSSSIPIISSYTPCTPYIPFWTKTQDWSLLLFTLIQSLA